MKQSAPMTPNDLAVRRTWSAIGRRMGVGAGEVAGRRAGYDERVAMARASFWLFGAGATLALGSLALPADRSRNTTAMLVTIAIAYCVSLVPLVGYTKLPHWAFHLLTIVGTVLVSCGVYFAGARGDVYGLLYFWVVIYAGYFFRWGMATVHLALVAAAYATVLEFESSSVVSVAWVITVGTLTIATALILILTSRLAEALRGLVESESESQERGTRLEALIQSAPVAIIEMDPGANVRTWNSEAERLFGWTRTEVYGRQSPISFESLPGSSLPQAARFDEPTLQEASVQDRRGNFRRVAFKRAAVRCEDGSQIGTIELAIDVTERLHLEEQLRRAQNMEAVGRLGGAIAHDFNNILLAIRSYTWLLADSLDGNSRQGSCLEEIEKAVDRATVLTRQLLVFSQRQIEAPSVTDLNELLHDITGMIRPLVGESVELVIKPSREEAPVLANVTQLEQVVVNLAVNARQAMPHGGTLVIEVLTPAPEEGHRSSLPGHGADVILRISDTGVGLDADQRRRIFEPFYTTRKAEGGTGLGLSTVYGIVTAGGGSIDVLSTPGVGTTFTMRFPRASQRPQEAPESASAGRLTGNETILLVEDDESVRVPLQRFLEQCGYTVLSASDGVAALELAAAFPGQIELVITDIVMPSMGGEELVDRLLEARPSTRVLYISGYAGSALGLVDEDATEPVPATALNAASRAEFLQKPFAVEQLAAAMRSLLDDSIAA
jgi:two-component system, cell cycle sensor histidine kinase and response regulator CckA